MVHEEWQQLLVRLANAADKIALRHFRSPKLQVGQKPGGGGPVTQADIEIEQAARRMVEAGHPDLGFLGEESGAAGGKRATRLIIDPIDATQNFARGIPIFATLLAIEQSGEIVSGMVSAPALATRWSALRGGGAFRNHDRIRVSRVARLEDAHLFHAGFAAMGERAPAVVGLARRAGRSRGFGDFYQHMLVAEGAGEIALDFDLQPWDIAPLVIIIEEAGGRATSATGERGINGGSLLSTNGLLHAAALEGIAQRAPAA